MNETRELRDALAAFALEVHEEDPTYLRYIIEGHIAKDGGPEWPALQRVLDAIAALRTSEPSCVKIPVNEDEAALMVMLGDNWLRENAPHRLRAAPSDGVDEIIGALVKALKRQDAWHLQRTEPDPEFGFIPADEYGDSTMYEETTAAVHAAEVWIGGASPPVSPELHISGDVEARIARLARLPWLLMDHGDGSDTAGGCKGWQIEAVTGSGAVVSAYHPTLEAALDEVEAAPNVIVVIGSAPPVSREPEIVRLMDALEMAWGLIANAGEGNWDREHPNWQFTAGRWRDEHWHPALDRNGYSPRIPAPVAALTEGIEEGTTDG